MPTPTRTRPAGSPACLPKLLAASCRDGCTEATMLAITASPSSRWSSWCAPGSPTATAERVVMGRKVMVARVRITEMGRKALAER